MRLRLSWKWIVGISISLLAIVAPILYQHWRDYRQQQEESIRQQEQNFIQEQQRLAEAEERLKRETPKLRNISTRIDKGDRVLTLAHESPNRHARITNVYFYIDDPRMLAWIRQRHPEPPVLEAGAPNDEDHVAFERGKWQNGRYCFYSNVGLNVPPGSGTDFRLVIRDPRYAGTEFRGTVEFMYDAGPHFDSLEV